VVRWPLTSCEKPRWHHGILWWQENTPFREEISDHKLILLIIIQSDEEGLSKFLDVLGCFYRAPVLS
jgi:hypothetical protein